MRAKLVGKGRYTHRGKQQLQHESWPPVFPHSYLGKREPHKWGRGPKTPTFRESPIQLQNSPKNIQPNKGAYTMARIRI